MSAKERKRKKGRRGREKKGADKDRRRTLAFLALGRAKRRKSRKRRSVGLVRLSFRVDLGTTEHHSGRIWSESQGVVT